MRIVKIGVIVLAAVGLAIWLSASRDEKKTEESIRIGLNPWLGNGIYYVAKEKGFFAVENINVKFEAFDDGAIGKQLLNTNKIDVLPLTPETVVVLADAGVKVKVVAMSDSSEGADGIVAAPGIQSLSDLKGKKVAFETGPPSHFLLSYLLDQQGLSTEDLTAVNSPAPDAGASFVAGEVDAAVTWEPWLSKATERAGGHVLASSKVLPIFPDMLILREETVEDRSEDIRALLRAIFAAQEWILSHESEAVGIIAGNLNISDQEVREQLPMLRWLSYEDNVEAFNAHQPEDLIQKASDLWLKLGLTNNRIDASEVVDESLLRNLYGNETK